LNNLLWYPDNFITGVKLADNSISNGKIISVDFSKITNVLIDVNSFADNSITNAKINSIDFSKITNVLINNLAMISDSLITGAKIALNSINGNCLINNSITNSK
jgi:hypothetical protein